MVDLTDELLEQLGKEYEDKKTEEIMTGIYEVDTFYMFVERKLKELSHDTIIHSKARLSDVPRRNRILQLIG